MGTWSREGTPQGENVSNFLVCTGTLVSGITCVGPSPASPQIIATEFFTMTIHILLILIAMITITNYHDGKEKTAPSESFYRWSVITVITYGKCLNTLKWMQEGWK